MKREVDITLNFKEKRYDEILLKQMDTTVLNITLKNDNQTVDFTNLTADCIFTKPNGTIVIQNANISNDKVVVNLKEDCLRQYGKGKIEIELKKDEEVISTFQFDVKIEKTSKGNVESDNTLNYIEYMEDTINEARESIPGIVREEVDDKLPEIQEEIEAEVYGRISETLSNKVDKVVGKELISTTDLAQIQTNAQNILQRSLITETGSQIQLTIDTDYKMTAILKDKNGNTIYTSNVIDLPLETMIVNASYDNATKEIVLTLQNGNTTRFSVADLVNGLVSTATFNTALANKVDKVNGKGLSTNDFTNEYKEQIETNASDILDINEAQTTQDNRIAELEEENELLRKDLAGLPTNTATGESVDITDSAEMRFEKLDVGGNSKQNTSEMTYVCNGTETGKYYFTYNNVNYQFTMPTITEGDVLIFNTTTLKLYLADTEIATTTDNTGILIKLNDSPNPEYEQPVHSVGDNVNLFDKDSVIRNKMVLGSGELMTFDGVFSSDFISVNSKETYHANKYAPTIVGFDENKNPIGYIQNSNNEITFSPSTDCKFIRIRSFDATIPMEEAIAKAKLEKRLSSNTI